MREGTCLLGHPVDPSTLSDQRGRRTRHPRRGRSPVTAGAPGRTRTGASVTRPAPPEPDRYVRDDDIDLDHPEIFDLDDIEARFSRIISTPAVEPETVPEPEAPTSAPEHSVVAPAEPETVEPDIAEPETVESETFGVDLVGAAAPPAPMEATPLVHETIVAPVETDPAIEQPRRRRTLTDLSPTGAMIENLWNTQRDATPVEEWETDSGGFDRLSDRTWVRRVAMLAVVVVAVGVGWYLWQPGRSEQRAVEVVAVRASVLVTAIDGAGAAVDDLADGHVDDPVGSPAASVELSGAARDLFTAISDLPTGEGGSGLRSTATAAVQETMVIQNTLADAFAYESLLDTVLAPPTLSANPTPDDLASIGSGLAAWLAATENALAALPDDPLLADDAARAQVYERAAVDWQARYVDAVRDGGDTVALAAEVQELVATRRSELSDTISAIAADARGRLEAVRATLETISRSG